MVRRTIAECDQCGAPEAVTVHVHIDGSHWEVDLCPKHLAPVKKAAGFGREVSSSSPSVVGTPRQRFRKLDSRIEGVPSNRPGE